MIFTSISRTTNFSNFIDGLVTGMFCIFVLDQL